MTGPAIVPGAVAGGTARPGPVDPPSQIVPQRAVLVLSTSERHDSRSLRIAATLAGRGHEVTILARRGPDREATQDSAASGAESPDGYRVVRVGAPRPARTSRPVGALGQVSGEVQRLAAIGLAMRRHVREAAAVDPGADLYHGMAYQGIPIALSLARRGYGRVLYDARDLYPESGNLARMPAPVRTLAGLVERRWARRCDGIITVNDELAAILARRFDRPLPAVVMNCLPAWTPPPQPDRRFHARLGLAPETRVVLYHGGFLASRGIEVLAAAVMQLPGVALVAMGDGPLRPALERLAGVPSANGRIHILPPVPPAELVPWIAAADVGAMLNQPVSRNERISTPNKLFECLAAGVPVVSSDFPGRRRIVIDDPDGPLGAVCDPTDPGAIALALRDVLDRSAEETADLRRRVLAAAHARWTWDRQAATLLDVYGRLTGRPW
jgi:glycosyltransferase involved in cell wall biosynthesis